MAKELAKNEKSKNESDADYKSLQSEDVSQYIFQYPAEIQEIMNTVRATVCAAAPNATESISWKMPAYKPNGKPLIYFAGHKNHVGLYPLPSGIEAFADELANYKNSGKGTVQFPYNKPLLVDLIRRIVEFRVADIQ